MPNVSLGRYEIEEYDPPEVCMKCGAPSTVVVRKTFSWYPQWIVLIFFVAWLVALILMAVLTKRMTVRVPLCEEHKGHWTKRTIITLLGFLGVLIFLSLAIAALVSDDVLPEVAYVCWSLVALGLLAWLIMVVILQQSAIRPTEITDRSITLTGVSEGYIEALREDRGDSDDDDRPRRSRRDDDDDDRPRKRRRLPEDEEDEAPRPKAKDRSDGVYDPKKSKRRQEDSEAIQGDAE